MRDNPCREIGAQFMTKSVLQIFIAGCGFGLVVNYPCTREVQENVNITN
ncbi:MAG: hypothetical protein BWY09_02210 [Candidatus Hydrogenedentes bacterium ADurb.Bin179]|nr:MAG: hypothetical protein BWY09_02210 [Candidatus Hydrogenedentes bacterium ADurb.Bin179]